MPRQEVGRPVSRWTWVASWDPWWDSPRSERAKHSKSSILMAHCVVMIDENEKAFAGATGGQGDSGVSSRMFGTLLTWLNDHTSDAFVVCTANDVSRLPPEFSRGRTVRRSSSSSICQPQTKGWHLGHVSRTVRHLGRGTTTNDEQWTGAEIRSCCRLAALLDVPLTQAAHNVVPVATTSAESVQRLREWASGSLSGCGVWRLSSRLRQKKDSESTLSVRRRISRVNSRREAS